MKPVAIQTVLENNTHDPEFCEAVNVLIKEHGVTFYLGDDSEDLGYDHDLCEEELFNDEQFAAWRNEKGMIRMTEWDFGSGHNDYFSCEK